MRIEKRLEIQPLTKSQMQEFVCAYLPEHGEKLWQQLQGEVAGVGGNSAVFVDVVFSIWL